MDKLILIRQKHARQGVWPVPLIWLQTELKYPSKNRRRFTQRYNMTKIIFS